MTDSHPDESKECGDSTSGRRLRIAVLNRIFRPTGGGAERYSIALVEQLAPRHDIHVFAQQVEHQWPGVTYHRVVAGPPRPRWINQLWFALATWWLTRRGFDVVHSHENTWHGSVQTVHVVPVKYSLFRQLTRWAKVLRWIRVFTSPRLLAYLALEHWRYQPRPDRVVVLASNTLRPIMEQAYPQARNALRVVSPGVAAVHGQTSAQDRIDARVALALPQAGRCVLFVGNDYRKKGLSALLQAMRSLPEDCFLAVVGNAGQVEGFKEEVKAQGVAQRVFFMGALNAMETAYRAADCLAHPTLEDTFAMVVLEAMAFGLPVVVSDVRYCGIAELLTHEVNALLLDDPRDARGLSEALRRVLFDASLTEKLVQAGTEFARLHVWSEQANLQDYIYRFAVAQSSR